MTSLRVMWSKYAWSAAGTTSRARSVPGVLMPADRPPVTQRTRVAKEPLRTRGDKPGGAGQPAARRAASAATAHKATHQGAPKPTAKPTAKPAAKNTAQPAGKDAAKRESKSTTTADTSQTSGTPPTRRHGKRRVRRFLRRQAKGVAFVILFPPVAAAAALFWYARGIPLPADSLSTQTTFVYAASGQEMASFRSDTDRTNVALADIPVVMRNAVLASEDKSFYSHNGVDPTGILRAVYRDVRNEGVQQGGSTLTQQYVKISYTGRERSYKRKLREVILSVKLERKLTKDEIFERYLNSVYFGRGATGVQAAAKAYFEKDARALSLPEAAYLAGVLRAPENTDARRNPERAKFRRDSVLTNMAKLGFISETERAAAAEVPLTGVGGIVRAKPSSTINFREAGTQYAVDMVRRELITRFGAAKVFGGGLRVTTTVDLKTQQRARAVVFDQVLNQAGDPDAAMVVLDHEGRIKALVGGRNYDELQVNLAAGRGYGGPGRQAGSTFKPFVLAAAVREGIAVESTFSAPASIVIPGADVDGTDWEVSNFDDVGYSSDIDLRTATAQSVNTVYAQLVTDERVGAQRVADMAKDLGITSPLDAYPALALGTEEVSPLEMADAYLTFAREGVRVRPRLIGKVTDASGEVLWEPEGDPTRVLSTNEAAIVNRTLRSVVEEGSGVKAQLRDGRQVAGKTGTTQNARDAWFVGYTPQNCCVVAIWMGFASSNKPMTEVHGRRVTGGAFPADIFGRFMNEQVANLSTGEFAEPDQAALGVVIQPKLQSQPVKKKKRTTTVVDTSLPPDATDVPNDAVPIPETAPPIDPVPAGNRDLSPGPAQAPTQAESSKPVVQPNSGVGPVEVAPPVVVVEPAASSG